MGNFEAATTLEGKIQERYGIAKDQARQEIDDWFTSQGFSSRLDFFFWK
jgi:hypothetical protein